MGKSREPRLVRYRGWYAVAFYDDRGIRRRHSLGTDDGARAAAGFAEWKRQTSLSLAGGPLTVEAIYRAYVNDAEAEGKPSAPRMLDAWKRLQGMFAPLSPLEVSPELCRFYRAERKRTVGDGTIHVELGYLRAALRYALKRNWISQAPHVPLPPKPQHPRAHLTREEARRLIAAAAFPHVRLFLVLAIATAARAGALLDLTWERVDLNRRRIYLRDPERQATPKGRATVPINDMALAALSDAKEGAMTPFVIEWGGDRLRSVRQSVTRTGERCGLKVSPHVLRHTAAVWMAEDGVPMSEIAQYLGHTSTAVTERTYARYSPGYLQRAASALEL